MPTEVTVQATLFESLVRCKPVDASLRADLLAAGYDMERPRAVYPAHIFIRCQELVLRSGYGNLERSFALREMGRDLVRRYFDTLVGRVVGVALKMAGPERAMKRVALSFSSVFSPVNIVSESLGPRNWSVRFRSYPFPAEAAAGTCEVALQQAGAGDPVVVVDKYEADGFDLRIKW